MSACFIQFLQNTLEGDRFVSIKENPVQLNLYSPTSENSGNFLTHLPFITSSPGFRLYEVTVISLILWEKKSDPTSTRGSTTPVSGSVAGAGLGTSLPVGRFSRWRRVLFVSSAGFFKANHLLVECPWFPP